MMPTPAATKIHVSPTAARAELARRTLAKRNFLRFCQYVDPRYQTPVHIQYVAGKLQRVAQFIESNGQEGISRLMIELPPRHGKSELASRKFPAWLMGRMPDTRVILASYGADLASKHSRAVRDLINSAQYQALFGIKSSKDEPVLLSSDSRSVAAWDLENSRGGMVAAGVGGGITGLGSDLLVLDDLFKNREEGESEPRREFVDDWYKSSAYTRLEPNAAIILFFTRWHPDDQAGRLIKRMAEDPEQDQWEIVFLPAVALDDYPADEKKQREKMLEGIYLPLADPLGRKPGEALWLGRFGREWLDKKKTNIGDYEFTALYQQMPYAKEGTRYKRDWFHVINRLPEGVTILWAIRFFDKAGTTTGDFTVGVLMGYGSDGLFYILDVARGQWTSYERDDKMKKTGNKDLEKHSGHYQIWHQQDPGSAGLDSAVATNRVLKGLPAFFETVSGSKETRSEPLESGFQGKLVVLLRGAWNDPFIEEFCAFPRGKNDDQVDAGSSAYSKLLEIVELLEEPPQEEQIMVYEERVEISPV